MIIFIWNTSPQKNLDMPLKLVLDFWGFFFENPVSPITHSTFPVQWRRLPFLNLVIFQIKWGKRMQDTKNDVSYLLCAIYKVYKGTYLIDLDQY